MGEAEVVKHVLLEVLVLFGIDFMDHLVIHTGVTELPEVHEHNACVEVWLDGMVVIAHFLDGSEVPGGDLGVPDVGDITRHDGIGVEPQHGVDVLGEDLGEACPEGCHVAVPREDVWAGRREDVLL